MSRITAVVCTFDRYQLLEGALAALALQTLTQGDYRILVVDNSPDRAKAEAFRERNRGLANLTYLLEPRPGLSNARNAAIAACRDDLIAFIDDDAIARPSWLAQLVRAFDEIGPAAAVVGGTVELIWPAPRPSWIPDGLLPCLSAVNWGDIRRELVPPAEWLAGTNVAFRRAALAAAGGFSPLLGRYGHGAVLLSNDETETIDRIRGAGGRMFFEPAAIVDHLAHRDRLTREWFRRRIAWQTISNTIAAVLRHNSRPGGTGASGDEGNRRPAIAAATIAELCRDTDDANAFAAQIHDVHALIRALIEHGTLPHPPPAAAVAAGN